MKKYFSYVGSLSFESDCDYQFLKSLFWEEVSEMGRLDWQFMEEYRGIQDEVTSQQSQQRIIDSRFEVDSSRQNKFLGVPTRNGDLNVTVSVGSSRANNYQNSLQRSYGNLIFLGSNRQFDEIKLGTNQSLSISQSPKERFLQFLFDDQFNDLDICQDDEPNIQMKKPRSLKKKQPSYKKKQSSHKRVN